MHWDKNRECLEQMKQIGVCCVSSRTMNIRGEALCRKMNILDELNKLWPVQLPSQCPCKYVVQGVDPDRNINHDIENRAPNDISSPDKLLSPANQLASWDEEVAYEQAEESSSGEEMSYFDR
ncbi:uncharacterized protein LOC116805460 [Drosophila grimshawi]|uniref:uncharacterized protein LOC116805460 n=1 Tax=Drosophila grimshawi TaxID=7222 RepID=UPI000C8707C8|nr:uncharacterized protein LOC116805460 [Drosophila grimshawi]